jgi:protoporphyrinogen oxidase
MGMWNLISASVDLMKARAQPQPENANFAQRAYHRYGKTVAEAFLIGYSEKLWGVPAEKLTPAVSGGRLKGLSARTMFYELLRGKRSKTEHLDGSFYYPRGGYGRIAERLAESIGHEKIMTNTRVTRIRHHGNRITSLELNGAQVIEPGRVINTLAPAQILSLLDPAPPQDLQDLASKLRFRDLILVALFLDKPRVTRNASIYFPSPEIPFTRLYEPKNRSIELAPPKQTCVVVELPCFAEDAVWRESDDTLKNVVAQKLQEVNLIGSTDVIGSQVHRLKLAYPVLEIGTEEIVSGLRGYLARFLNLYTVGRAGRFEYTHIHDLLRQGKDLAGLLKVEEIPEPAFDIA